jgi:hypothetical protein
MTRKGELPFILAVVLVLTHVRSPAADPSRGTVVILSMAACCEELAWPEAEDALAAELELVDISVRIAASRARGEVGRQEELERVTAETGAAAAVRLAKSRTGPLAGAELWIVDRVTGKTSYRRIEVDRSRDASAVIDVAVRVVEALRASLVELRMTGRSDVSEENADPQITALAETSPVKREGGLFGLGLGASFNLSPGGTGARGSFSLTGIAHPIFGLDVELSVLYSPIGKHLKTENDISTFDYVLVTGGIFYRFFHNAAVQPALGILGGALIAWTEGRTAGGTPLRSDSEAVAFLGAGIRLFVFPVKMLGLFLGSHVGLTLPEIQTRHGDIPAARFGRPFIEIALGAQLRFINTRTSVREAEK